MKKTYCSSSQVAWFIEDVTYSRLGSVSVSLEKSCHFFHDLLKLRHAQTICQNYNMWHMSTMISAYQDIWRYMKYICKHDIQLPRVHQKKQASVQRSVKMRLELANVRAHVELSMTQNSSMNISIHCSTMTYSIFSNKKSDSSNFLSKLGWFLLAALQAWRLGSWCAPLWMDPQRWCGPEKTGAVVKDLKMSGCFYM